ncbi:MAG: hypothetical protein ACM3IH_15015 [Sphingobacteriales bacterium]
MTQYDDSNRGQIWKNDRKEKDTHPDFKGSQNIVCPDCGKAHDYWVSAWKRKEGANPKAPALSWKSEQKDGQRAAAGTERTAARPSLKDEMNDEIPF